MREKAFRELLIEGSLLKILQGDLVRQEVEAIVNAANPLIEGGGGVDGKIHQKAGPALAQACKNYKEKKKISKIKVADVLITDSFDIQKETPAIRYVIHTVGPDCRVTEEREAKEELLQTAYVNVLDLARDCGIHSIAFPAISTGAYNFPFWEAQQVAIKAIKEYLESYPKSFFEVRLVYYSEEDFENAERVWNEVF
jgi:O-acetyl-ADP-ribose deacetylase